MHHRNVKMRNMPPMVRHVTIVVSSMESIFDRVFLQYVKCSQLDGVFTNVTLKIDRDVGFLHELMIL